LFRALDGHAEGDDPVELRRAGRLVEPPPAPHAPSWTPNSLT